MITLADKIFLALLAAIPLLTAIYFLFRKSKPLVVSALMLWAEQRPARRSGMTWKKMPLPLTYFLEALIILALALAAASPLLLRKNDAAPLTLVLDNSFSMQAGAPQSPRDRALREITSLVREMAGRKFRLVIAGTDPRNLGEFATAADLTAALRQWSCDECGDSLAAAVAMARRLDQDKCSVMVFTDRLPASSTVPANLSWHALGVPRDNVAIVNASRIATSGHDRAMVVIANIAKDPARTVLKVRFPGSAQPPMESELALAPEQLKKVSLDLPAAAGPVEFSLLADALDFDNRIVLLPENRPLLRVELKISDRRIRSDVQRALDAGSKVALVAGSPVLTITDHADLPETGGYRLFVRSAKKGTSTAGPFTLSRNHPLCTGLDLTGIIWGLPADAELPGIPVIAAGDRPLLTAEAKNRGGDLYLAYVPGASTLQNTPAWPILFWNLADWLSNNRPGPPRVNFHSGEKIPFNRSGKKEPLELTAENGQRQVIPAAPGKQWLSIVPPGTYELAAGTQHYRVRVNPLNYRESDLRQCGTGVLEGEKTAAVRQHNYFDVAWIPLLLALLLLILHQLLIGRKNHEL